MLRIGVVKRLEASCKDEQTRRFIYRGCGSNDSLSERTSSRYKQSLNSSPPLRIRDDSSACFHCSCSEIAFKVAPSGVFGGEGDRTAGTYRR
ncbi:hypothetical protein CEXT_167661 [Caerostris extrusa]|uniref:Uncharacterized protein n=1 Tax=Caerostris extrusa TaxID=172846 RepID=A0AAV4Y579_CAEEX|nr:hypothetical protein CEXT_167661 [Caerostris extrusa]